MKKCLALILALVMVFALAACGGASRGEPTPAPTAEPTPEPTPEPTARELLTRALQQMENCGSYHQNTTFTIRMSLELEEETDEITLSLKVAGDTVTEPLSFQKETVVGISLSAPWSDPVLQEMKQLSCGAETEDGFRVYFSEDGGEHWSVQDGQELLDTLRSNYDMAERIEAFVGSAELLEKTGVDSRDGRTLDLYTGRLTGEAMAQGLESSGLLETLGGLGGLGGGITPDLFDDLGEIPYVIALERESGRLAWYEMDCSQAMQTMMDRIISRTLSGQSGESGLSVTIGRAKLRCEFSAWDEVDAIEIPEAALAAGAETAGERNS